MKPNDAMIKVRLYEYRSKRKVTQEKLAELTGISKNTISLIERGSRTPTLKTIYILSEALKISVDDLLSDYLVGNSKKAKKNANYTEIKEYMALASESQLQIILKILNALSKYKERL